MFLRKIMNTETKIKIILVAFIGLLLVSSILEFLYFKRIISLSLGLLITMITLLVLSEAYLRIQHNIERKFLKTKKMLFELHARNERNRSEQIGIVKQKLEEQKERLSELKYLTNELGTLGIKNESNIEDINYVQKDIMRSLLEEKINKGKKKEKEDVTIIIGTRNRTDYRLENSLKSIRQQGYPKELIKILLVDYGSKSEFKKTYKKLCKKYQAEYLRINNVNQWNRSNCLNLGIKKANTKYLLVSDTDIIFEQNYLKEAIEKIKENSYSIVYSKKNLSKEGDITPKTNLKDYEELLSKTKRGHPYNYANMDFWQGMSIILGRKEIFKILGGYDENFRLWGCEDDDLIKRFSQAGVQIIDISKKTSHIHQWHKNLEGVNKNKKIKEQIEKNKDYMKKSKSIFR
ncbi:glycosyltransferase [Candidatus Pacearchaeota archaeon]|nr:glycosyltransferase [Candidatus Pacearchaeota archaeon]